MNINGRVISQSQKPYIIAEMSGNHNQSLDRAKEIVRQAAQAGADAVKLQTYTADTMTLDVQGEGFSITDERSLWKGRTLHALYAEAHTPWDWHQPIFELARELGIEIFSTPFDESAVDLLEELGVHCYKVASFENTDIPLITKIANTGKPMIISTGMAELSELDESVRAARVAGCRDLVLLKCTSTYPASPENTNLRTIPALREMFGCEVGLSDHTMGIGVAVASIALGASVIEKHFTLSRADGGVDSAFSIEPAELDLLVEEAERAWQALGRVSFGPSKAEQESLAFRRSLYVVDDLAKGAVLTEQNVRAIRPGFGLAPKHMDTVLGVRVTRDIKRGTPLSWDIMH